MEICGGFNYMSDSKSTKLFRDAGRGEVDSESAWLLGRDPNAKVVVTSVCFNEPRRI